MQINKISNINYINNSFRANNVSRDAATQNAILMLRDPQASIKFQQNQDFAHPADSVSANPFKALGYKLYRTFSMIRENDQAPQTEEKQFVAIA